MSSSIEAEQEYSCGEVRMGQVLKEVLSQIKIGADITRISVPAMLCQPRSLLQKLTAIMSRGHFLIQFVFLEIS